jgi:hypothetical protein
MEPVNVRLGYTVSGGVYLPAAAANGVTVTLASGSATAYAGAPDAPSHRMLATITAGVPYIVTGLAPGEVLSVQSEAPFAYTVTPPQPQEPPVYPDGTVHSVAAFWQCNLVGCNEPDWVGSVINWPSWSAYEMNNRTGAQSRTVYSSQGTLLYPYMGPWANGCQVTAVHGVVMIIEWERGTDVWRSTILQPGESHTIQLTAPENGAMIETDEGLSTQFSVLLNNCNPQPVPK